MRRLGLVTMIAALAATPAPAAIDFDTTNNGLPHLSGGRKQFESYGLAGDLFSTNNKLIGQPFTPCLDESRDWSQAVDPEDGPLPLGCLVEGRDGTLWTYDRLASLPVLQLIGFDQTETFGDRPRFDQQPPPRQLTIMPSFESITSMAMSAPPDESIPPPIATPEPASLGLLLAGGALLLTRPRRRHDAPPAAIAPMTA